MRTLLEKAIVHLLNEEHEKAEKLFHEFMVARARQIHESMRGAGNNAILSEDWDSEITSEEYFSEDDLKDAEDEIGDDVGADVAPVDDEGSFGGDDDFGSDDVAVAGDELGDEMGVDGDDALGAEGEMGGEGEGEVSDRLADMSDQLADIQAEFDKIMAELDGDIDSDAADGADDGGFPADDAVDGEGEGEGEADEFDFGGDEGGAAENADDAAEAGDLEDDMAEDDDEKKVSEDMDFDDIAESILNDLDKVNVDLTDGKEVGSGKTITKNEKSVALQKGVNDRKGAAPVHQKSDNVTTFEREPAPEVRKMKPRRNNVSTTDAALKPAENAGKGADLRKSQPQGPQKSPVNANSGSIGN